MSRWLDPVRQALESGRPRAPLFFRNDDVGWADDRLLPLLDLFEARSVPADLAVIPAALSDAMTQTLADRCAASDGRLRLHQHGWRHVDHENGGRKCEFGPSRAPDVQAADLHAGKERLRAVLAPFVDPIFSPPWNRCTQATADLLPAASMRVLSRNAEAAPLDTGIIAELSVAVDWDKEMARADSAATLGRAVADAIDRGNPVGIMLHHASMGTDSLAALAALLDLLAEHEHVRCLTMMDCAGLGRR